jgi:hypothetical protein
MRGATAMRNGSAAAKKREIQAGLSMSLSVSGGS